MSIYYMIRTILRYDTIHTIYTQYRTIYKHLRYANIIWNFLHKIWYLSYRTYGQQCLRVSEDQNKLTGYQVCEILRYMILIVIFLHLVYIFFFWVFIILRSLYRTWINCICCWGYCSSSSHNKVMEFMRNRSFILQQR